MMSWKSFSLNTIWAFFSVFWIGLLSLQDKEWWIGEGGIKNICDLMTYIENDDIRDVGMLFTLPLFFPAMYVLLFKRVGDGFTCLVTLLIAAFWLWRFIVRYQLCLW